MRTTQYDANRHKFSKQTTQLLLLERIVNIKINANTGTALGLNYIRFGEQCEALTWKGMASSAHTHTLQLATRNCNINVVLSASGKQSTGPGYIRANLRRAAQLLRRTYITRQESFSCSVNSVNLYKLIRINVFLICYICPVTKNNVACTVFCSLNLLL